MGALNYISYVIMAALFISLAAWLFVQYTRANEEQQFRAGAEELAGRINSLARQSPGTVWHHTIKVPSWCELRFHDNLILVVTGSSAENIPVVTGVQGPDLSGIEATLRLERTDSGIAVSAL
ncbi:MAG: hypothetical protein QW567_03640 [Candidatus Hadarchaeales archaeon]